MVAVPIQPKYAVLGGLAVISVLAAVTLIPHHRPFSVSVHDSHATSDAAAEAPVLQADLLDLTPSSVDVTVNGVKVEPNSGTQHVATPNGTATVTVTENDNGQSASKTVTNGAGGSVNINVTSQNNSGTSNSSTFSSSSSFTSVSGFSSSNSSGTQSQLNVHVSQ